MKTTSRSMSISILLFDFTWGIYFVCGNETFVISRTLYSCILARLWGCMNSSLFSVKIYCFSCVSFSLITLSEESTEKCLLALRKCQMRNQEQSTPNVVRRYTAIASILLKWNLLCRSNLSWIETLIRQNDELFSNGKNLCVFVLQWMSYILDLCMCTEIKKRLKKFIVSLHSQFEIHSGVFSSFFYFFVGHSALEMWVREFFFFRDFWWHYLVVFFFLFDFHPASSRCIGFEFGLLALIFVPVKRLDTCSLSIQRRHRWFKIGTIEWFHCLIWSM